MLSGDTYAVIGFGHPVATRARRRGMDRLSAERLALRTSQDFHGTFSVVRERDASEFCAFKEGRRYRSYVTAMGGTLASIKRGVINREAVFREALDADPN